jgi:hypothetical protein
MKRNVIFLLLVLLFSACSAAVPEIAPDVPLDLPPKEVVFVTAKASTATMAFTPLPSTPEPSPTATEREVPIVVEAVDIPTPQPEPTATDALIVELSPTPEPDWLNNYGRTADNLVYLGNPDAPVSIIDFSDFM